MKTGRKKVIERRKGTPRAWVARGMRLPLIIASIACSMAQADSVRIESPRFNINSKRMGLNLRVQDGGWGNARRETIETVLYSVADELLSKIPKKLAVPIVITHTDRNPVALYERGPGGEYRVYLHASGQNWHLYVYEFAHELCHILSNYEENVDETTTKYNQWFEEALCETASLFALKNLAATWEVAPPEPRLSEEAGRLRRFFDHLIAEGHRQLPQHTPLADWLRDNEDRLRNNPYLREKNEVVANLLLPLFEKNPQDWETLSYLNLGPNDALSSLEDYLDHWYKNAPLERRLFVGSVLALLLGSDSTPVKLAAAPVMTSVKTLATEVSRK